MPKMPLVQLPQSVLTISSLSRNLINLLLGERKKQNTLFLMGMLSVCLLLIEEVSVFCSLSSSEHWIPHNMFLSVITLIDKFMQGFQENN